VLRWQLAFLRALGEEAGLAESRLFLGDQPVRVVKVLCPVLQLFHAEVVELCLPGKHSNDVSEVLAAAMSPVVLVELKHKSKEWLQLRTSFFFN
jgi:hypothetical protein